MKVVRNVALIAGASLLTLAAVVAVRTVTWKPEAGAAKPAALAAATPVDAARAAAHLGEAIRFQTVSNQDAAANRWEEWDKLHAWMQATYPAAHAAMTRELVDGRTLIYAWPGSDPKLPPIVLMAHQDVVPVTPGTEKDWVRPPFGGAIAEGYVWGRGAFDDKGSLVALMEAADALAGRGFRPRRTVYFVFGHDEEALGSGAATAAKWFADRKIRPEFVLDEGGVAVTTNALTGKPVAVMSTAEKGYATLRVTATAEGGHSSAPPKETAVVTLARAVDRIAGDPFPLQFEGPGAQTVRGMAAGGGWPMRMLVANDWLFGPLLAGKMGETPQLAAMLHTTLAPTMLEGAPKENVLPQRASALINYRLHPRDRAADVMARARRAVRGLPVELSWEAAPVEASPVSSSSDATWSTLAALATEATGAPTVPGIVIGATDSRWFGPVAERVYRFAPFLVPFDELSRFHGTNERVSVENLDRAAEFYTRVIATTAG
ncbi:M20 family peptidase [Caulobacter sp. 17J80-11]|uniref:M20 family peptidase n=1 Tax=Caulobacter sp. 17J80-11 TaxID=2763502 RepID=UPI001653B239|nr:M20 family peptidase [Caulobacter sp. 17J80-11]MBC6980341.1 M20 family peptidase [Caulobacter sp. 17J80-11]